MTNQSTTVVRGGGGLLGTLAVLLTVLFVAFKLIGVISWSWWAVFAPILVYMGLGVALLVLFLLGAGITLLVAYFIDRHKLNKWRKERTARGRSW